MAILQFCLFALFSVAFADGNYVFSNQLSFLGGSFNVSYNFNESSDTFEFLVEVNATGWVGFGFAESAPNNMTDYDVAVGGVFPNGSVYLKDYFTYGFTQPPEDTQQDWTLKNATEMNGITALKFCRQRNTSDAQDVAIKPGMPIFLIVAYHDTMDVSPRFRQHTKCDYQEKILIPEPQPEPSAVSPPPTSTPTAVSNFISLDGGNYNVSWMFNSSMDTFHFVVKVRATGWIGFGLATQAPNGMMGYDVAVSGTNNGTKYLKDYFTRSFAAPPQDAQQDWMISYFSEEQNMTTLKFYRKRDTNDTANDIAIQPGQSYYFIWAYHASDTVTPGRFPKHSFSGSYQVGPLIPSIQPTTTASTASTASTESPTTPGTALPTQTPFPYAFDDNKFLVRWTFDDQADKIYFHLRVKTTGWIGFGFAQTAPNDMRDYDVIVGGFSNGRGYLSDYKTFGRTRPTLDDSQDYTLLNASEAGGYTQLIFERSRDTRDENDFAFTRGSEVFIIWSYSNADITDQTNFGRHSSKGWSSKKYILVAENQPIPTEAKATALYSSFAIALSIALFHVLL
ncbi:PREDICTED: uncharacterized protein LOC107339531 isoform X2 [Acropora digitifera]|uniref:uncharacterized protein LOC107339531 isoform X2 n=1 Tax=Acropora digitifera TaxID=70779 RepID=UPI00077B13F0|nr:PREDICTED: uncharacterized protein LOC107339531 isoform X2 [Acropora digitifera]